MTLTDIEFNWVLAAAVLLCGFLVAVALLARGRKPSSGSDAAEDSWERMEERRRRKERLYATASYTLLFCCAGVAAALSFHGLVGFGRQNLNLSGGWEYLVPFGLDGAAMFCAVIAVREASQGDASIASRMLVWLFAGAAAWFNWVHAPRGEEHAGAPHFFAGMSLAAAILFDRALKQTRKAALREQGLVPRPLPQIRFVRWLRAPRETFAAWSLMLLEGVRTLDEAVDEVRDERQKKEAAKARAREERKLERARLRAMGHHRMLPGRGRQMALEAGQGGETSIEVSDGRAGREQPVGAGVGDSSSSSGPSSASPRLDSLEAKLAQIERSFG
ncbi:DUF2637 domain-containing protein [Streptomyces calidiresistens]|uniref:DUF2637 domain-containing protein n=1 Tax=Streptomyces calidiresistens TaxID=1485586 RepID=A0A7W3XWC3_9ACTN|nr:DUF2637 domain-containing protein [Streptomyces calidiresistens]MBB0229719.1 DUF2637 domain-containing protein [Streptomyces calidiresistens]